MVTPRRSAPAGAKRLKTPAGAKKSKTPAGAKKPRTPAAAEKSGPPFERVWALVRRIPRGRVATYGQLSGLIDRRLTPVGIGWAIRAAPEGSIPWQRVVNARGGISTDGEHPGLQRALLEAEGVRFDDEGTLDLERHAWRPRLNGRGRR